MIWNEEHYFDIASGQRRIVENIICDTHAEDAADWLGTDVRAIPYLRRLTPQHVLYMFMKILGK